MPTYTYVCKTHGAFDESRLIATRDEPASCPECKKPAKRDAMASIKPHTDTGYQTEMVSEALGVNPDQIPEIQKQFPHHRFNPKTGAMLIGSHQEFKRVLKDIGYRDWNSFN
jgi:putative FmdB family regulatory protein